MDNPDWKKLAQQEPEFVDWCKSALWSSVSTSQSDIIKALYGFYQVGMTAEQISEWMILNNKMNNGDGNG